MNADQKKRIAHEISNWKNACNCRAVQLTGDRMAALLQEMTDAPEPVPVAWRYEDAFGTHFTEDYSEFPNIPGVLSFTALFAVPPAPSVPDMPLSMERFGGLVGLARDDASEKAIVYKATNIYGETCYFGVKATAQAWAKSGNVDEVRLRDLRVVATPAPKPPKLSDERIFHHLVAILKAYSSGLKNYSMHKTIEDMKQAVRAIEREILGGAQA